MALLVTLERLNPVERAVFLLHDVFDYGYDEIAEIVGRSRDNCRQLALRARRAVEAGRARFEPSREAQQELAERFFAAARDGDLDALVELLAEDATMYGDGGGIGQARADAARGRREDRAVHARPDAHRRPPRPAHGARGDQRRARARSCGGRTARPRASCHSTSTATGSARSGRR